MSRIVRLHKWMGYTGVSLLLLHPFFLIMPKFFEAGVAPAEALVTILTTTNQGVILGILAWSLILILGLTALTRNRLPLEIHHLANAEPAYCAICFHHNRLPHGTKIIETTRGVMRHLPCRS